MNGSREGHRTKTTWLEQKPYPEEKDLEVKKLTF